MADALLEAMCRSPQDRRIDDVERLCRQYGIACTPPRTGSHYKVKHLVVPAILTIPAHRPIKAVYIRELVKFVDRVREAQG